MDTETKNYIKSIKKKHFEFKVMGRTIAKQSVKIGKWGKYTQSDMVEYANFVKLSFMEKYPSHNPSLLDNCYVGIKINSYFKIPSSFSEKKKTLARAGYIRPAKKPDWDNISKNICDALNKTVWDDDKCIVDGESHKYYSDYDYAEVFIDAVRINV